MSLRKTSFNKRIWSALDDAFENHAGNLLMGREDAAEGNYYGQECIVNDSYRELDKIHDYLKHLGMTDDSVTPRDYYKAWSTLQRIRKASEYSTEALEYILDRKYMTGKSEGNNLWSVLR